MGRDKLFQTPQHYFDLTQNEYNYIFDATRDIYHASVALNLEPPTSFTVKDAVERIKTITKIRNKRIKTTRAKRK